MALRAPPLRLSDQKAKARTCVLVNCAAFLAVWYAGLGGWALALALMVCFGLMLFVLRLRQAPALPACLTRCDCQCLRCRNFEIVWRKEKGSAGERS